jgi:hypothetical protein
MKKWTKAVPASQKKYTRCIVLSKLTEKRFKKLVAEGSGNAFIEDAINQALDRMEDKNGSRSRS